MKTKIARSLCALLSLAVLLSFGGCTIRFTGENSNKGKSETNPKIPAAAQGIYGALEDGIGDFSEKIKGLKAGMPMSDIGAEPFRVTYDFRGEFDVPSLGSGYGSLLEGLTLKGDMVSDLSDIGLNATIGLAAADGTLSANVYYDDATGLYFTIPGYMTEYLFVPPESLAVQGSSSADDFEQLDPAVITNFASALAALISEYADSVFTYIPDSAYADAKVSYTPLGASKAVNVTETTVTLTPADLSAVVKGIAGELSKDTTLFPAFVNALLDLMAAGNETSGEAFDRSAEESRIYGAVSEAAADGGDAAEFDKLEIKAYYTDDQFYEFEFACADSSDTISLSVREAPDTGRIKLTADITSGSPGDVDYFNAAVEADIGGEGQYEGMTPASFVAQFKDGDDTYQLSANLDFAVAEDEAELIGEITLTGASDYAELAFTSHSGKTAEGASFALDVSSLIISENQTELLSGAFSFSGTYSRITEAEASAMAPDIANAVDINSVDDTYMNNLMMNLISNPVIATLLQTLMAVDPGTQ